MQDFRNLDGQRFVLGARNSGAEQTGRYIFDALGIDYENRLSLAYMGYGGAANAIQDGNIVGMNVPAGAPVSAITQAFAQMGDSISLLNFTQEELDAINRRYDLWDWYDLPAGTYPNQNELVRSISSPNVLAVRSDVPEDVVYHITRTIWENLAALQDIHGATRDMRLARATRGLGAPLHPGAIRYYREQGLEIAPHLILPGDDRPADANVPYATDSAPDSTTEQ
jgi:TRAP transporter TAXI family solute receptor